MFHLFSNEIDEDLMIISNSCIVILVYCCKYNFDHCISLQIVDG